MDDVRGDMILGGQADHEFDGGNLGCSRPGREKGRVLPGIPVRVAQQAWILGVHEERQASLRRVREHRQSAPEIVFAD